MVGRQVRQFDPCRGYFGTFSWYPPEHGTYTRTCTPRAGTFFLPTKYQSTLLERDELPYSLCTRLVRAPTHLAGVQAGVHYLSGTNKVFIVLYVRYGKECRNAVRIHSVRKFVINYEPFMTNIEVHFKFIEK